MWTNEKPVVIRLCIVTSRFWLVGKYGQPREFLAHDFCHNPEGYWNRGRKWSKTLCSTSLPEASESRVSFCYFSDRALWSKARDKTVSVDPSFRLSNRTPDSKVRTEEPRVWWLIGNGKEKCGSDDLYDEPSVFFPLLPLLTLPHWYSIWNLRYAKYNRYVLLPYKKV